MSEAETLVAKIAHIISVKDSWAALQVINEADKKRYTVAGQVVRPIEGMVFEFTGKWVEKARYGRQFACEEGHCVIDEDHILPLLESGFVVGIGPAKARRLYDVFGKELMSIIRHNPEKLTTVNGIGPKTAAAIHASFLENERYFELCSFLKPEATDNQIRSFEKVYGENAVAVIQSNPYDLIDAIPGIGFRKADKLAVRQLNFPLDDGRRISAAIQFAMQEGASEGHIFLPLDKLSETAERLLGQAEGSVRVTENMLREAVRQALKDKRIVLEKSPDTIRVYLKKLWNAERVVARKLLEMTDPTGIRNFSALDIENGIKQAELDAGIQYEIQQKKAIRMALSNRVSVISGGPGTGKTTILQCIVSIYEKKFDEKVLLCAPTGRAAARMREAIGHDASTIHLAYNYEEKAACVIIDEVSMIDVNVACMALSLVEHGGRIVFVGDPDQLPAVGPGNVLRDILVSGKIPSIKLSVCYRYAGALAQAAHSINDGNGVEAFSTLPQDGSFTFIPARGSYAIQETALALYYDAVKAHGVENVCLLAPKRKECSSISVTSLNNIIRDKLNPAQGDSSSAFRVHDRVMLLKNGMGKNRMLANGDIGNIIQISPEGVIVRFDDGIEEPFEYDDFSRLFSLAYSSTIHKSQGQEFQVVILACSAADKYMLSRNLVYTAITRAKKKCYVVGEPEAVNYAAKKIDSSKRNTLLQIRLTYPQLAGNAEEEIDGQG